VSRCRELAALTSQAIRYIVSAEMLSGPKRCVAIMFVGLLMLSTQWAEAEERVGSTYVSVGFIAPWQSGVTDETHQTYVAAPGGVSWGWTAVGGVFVTKTISIDVEFSSTGLMTVREPSRYDRTFTEERRDRFFGGGVGFHVQPTNHVHLEPVLGLVIADHQGWSQAEIHQTYPVSKVVIDPRQTLNLPRGFGMSAGVDVRVGGPRVALLPSFRILFTTGGDNDTSPIYYPGGAPSGWTISPGIGVRFDF
jgi:hypothetical protein